MTDAVANALRQAWPEALDRLNGGDLVSAEDALQDAVLKALDLWPRAGIPKVPAAWLVRVAKNRQIDQHRHHTVRQRHAVVAFVSNRQDRTMQSFDHKILGWGDDLLRLVFTCCDPVLGLSERTALTLTVVAGLTCDEVANAFLVQPRTMAQRLTRARRRLSERRNEYTVPSVDEAPERVDAALAVLHLIFNEGYWSTGDIPIRGELCQLAIGLARSLVALLPEAPEAAGLLAGMELHHARFAARTDAAGRPIPLPGQDRSRWDQHQIQVATTRLRDALARGRPGAYQVEAAIAAVHCAADTPEATDWAKIARLYELLEAFRPSPVVRINRAFALGRATGPQAGLAILEPTLTAESLRSYPFGRIVRAALLAECGRTAEARVAYQTAHELARNDAERDAITRHIRVLDTPPTGRTETGRARGVAVDLVQALHANGIADGTVDVVPRQPALSEEAAQASDLPILDGTVPT